MAVILEDFIKQLDVLEARIIDGLVAASEEAALNAKALVVRRIQAEGVGEYSDKPLPVYFFKDANGVKLEKTKSNAGIRFIEKAAIEKAAGKRKGITWAEIRDAEGLQTEHVDLTFTGEMFRDLHILGTNVQRYKITTILGASRKETQDKLKYNAIRYGSFLDLRADELASVKRILQKRTTEILKTVFK